ncbi:MAG: hypothetical protein KJ645_08415, partial [Planctomycetes bacterium]|nr:hypothetical protein [Planctomycetota bacterium]
THDQEEALTMAHRVMLMDKEGIVQCGPPETLFKEPVNAWAAAFFGPVNRYACTIDEKGCAATPLGVVPTSLPAGTPCEILFRAAQVEGRCKEGGLPAQVIRSEFQGEQTLILCEREGVRIHAISRSAPPAVGTEIGLHLCEEPRVMIAAPGGPKP